MRWGMGVFIVALGATAEAYKGPYMAGPAGTAQPAKQEAAAQPTEAPKQEPKAVQPEQKARKMTSAEARKAAEEASRREFSDEQINEAGKALAIKRAERLAWLYNPAQSYKWFGVRPYLGYLWETRPGDGRPIGSVPFGAEMFFNPWGPLDLFGSIGGVSLVNGGNRAAVALDATAGVRWTFSDLVFLQLGYALTRHDLLKPGVVEGETIHTEAVGHAGLVGLGVTIRGATVLGQCRVGALPVQVDGKVEQTFSAFCGPTLLTPPIIGF